MADAWAAQERADGAETSNFRTHGYEMWLCGAIACGRRADGALLKLSGEAAERHLYDLSRFWSNVTRVDLALTLRCAPVWKDIGAIHYAEALAFLAANPTSAQPSHIENARDGDTCYLGKRTSDFYFRCYNKQAECEAERDEKGAQHYAGCWRYELEIKGPNALVQANRYAEVVETGPYVQTLLYDYAVKHGLCPLFGPEGPQALVSGFRRRSDRESKLRWLAHSVRPTLEWLSTNTDRATIMATLGLAETERAGDES